MPEKAKTSPSVAQLPRIGPHAYQIRDRLLAATNGQSRRGYVLVVTSCHRREGVTSVAASLALAMGESDRGRMILCDANMVSPAVHKLFSMEPSPGLTEAVSGECPPEEAIRTTPMSGLDVLPAGRRPMTLSVLIGSARFETLIANLRKNYSFVVIDVPPVVNWNAAARMAGVADGTLLVIEAERERWEVAQKVADLLHSSGAKIVGVVFNKRRLHIPEFLYKRL